MVNEIQYKILIEQDELEVIHIPSLKYFNDDWNFLQEYLESEGNPPYIIDDNLDIYGTKIESLGNLQSVGGDLILIENDIESLGNLQSVGGNLDLYESEIESLGGLRSVGGSLDLANTEIKSLGNLRSVGGNLYLTYSEIKSLGNLRSVGGDLFLRDTPISKKYSEEEIRQMVQVGGDIIK
jgi:hypothetical protein